MAAVNPKSTAIILLFSAAVVAASSTSMPPSPPPHYNAKSVEACIKLLFNDHRRRPPPSPSHSLCRDMLRTVAKSFTVTGKLSSEYVAALKKLPEFQNNPEALDKFLCGISPALASGCGTTSN